jgi:hypothetical protein
MTAQYGDDAKNREISPADPSYQGRKPRSGPSAGKCNLILDEVGWTPSTAKRTLGGGYWHASHGAPLRIASIEQASCSSAEYSLLPPAMPLTSFFTDTVDFSIFEAWSVRR